MMTELFWIVDGVKPEDGNADVTGWYGVVDEREGGIVAYAGTLQCAQMIRAMLTAQQDYS